MVSKFSDSCAGDKLVKCPAENVQKMGASFQVCVLPLTEFIKAKTGSAVLDNLSPKFMSEICQ